MPDDWIEITSQAISAEIATRFVTHEQAGGIALFLGTTRAESNSQGQKLLALDYEAYAQMALNQLSQLAANARKKWPILKLATLHRVGRVAIGEPSVVIAVSAPHRAEAFAACHWLIDQLKKNVAIWKKEVWADGSQTWV